MEPADVVKQVGREAFSWMARELGAGTTLSEIPKEILEKVAVVDIAQRDYGRDPAGLTAIALITFAYRAAGRPQDLRSGPKDILLLKVLAKEELRRRSSGQAPPHPLWSRPLAEILAGEVGDRIRRMPTLNSAGQTS